MAIKELLLLVGIVSGQSDEDIIKFADTKKVVWNQAISASTCKHSHEDRENGDYRKQYSTAHQRYWDAKMGKKGADKKYHEKHDGTEFGPDQDHDKHPDCEVYDTGRNKKDAKKQAEADAHRKEMDEIQKEVGGKSTPETTPPRGGLLGLFREAFGGHHK